MLDFRANAGIRVKNDGSLFVRSVLALELKCEVEHCYCVVIVVQTTHGCYL